MRNYHYTGYMKQVLLIDASPLFRGYLKEKLVVEQISVETATGNKDAYTKLITILPDIVIIDIGADLGNIIELLERKRVDPNACKIPIIISGPRIPRSSVANLINYGVVKYFTKPIKFDVFFDSIGKILKTSLTLDETPCTLETHFNGNIIFIEVSRGLNLEKISILKYKLAEMIDAHNFHDPKVILMLANLELSFVDGTNIELLLDNIIADERVLNKNVKVLSLSPFVKELVHGHSKYDGIEIATNLTDVLNSLVESGPTVNVQELVAKKILRSEEGAAGSVEMRFATDNGSSVNEAEDNGDFLHIAIVDDDIVVCKLLQNAFAALSVRTSAYVTGTKFMEESETVNFDLVILDLYIPDLNGFDILKNLKRKNFETPVLIYSQIANRDSIIQALSLGAKSFLAKPQKPAVIVQKSMEVINSNAQVGAAI